MKYNVDFYKNVPENMDRYKDDFLVKFKETVRELQDERGVTTHMMAKKAHMTASALTEMMNTDADPKLMTVAGLVRGGLGLPTKDFFAIMDGKLEEKPAADMQVLIEAVGTIPPEDRMEALGLIEYYKKVKKSGRSFKFPGMEELTGGGGTAGSDSGGRNNIDGGES